MRLMILALSAGAVAGVVYVRGTLQDTSMRLGQAGQTVSMQGAEAMPEIHYADGSPVDADPLVSDAVSERIHQVLRAKEEREATEVDADSGESVPVPPSRPVRHSARLHDEMITPGNFKYLGAFRPPHIENDGVTFGYGGWAMAYRPDGDPDSDDDGFPGSLYIVGHQQHQKVAELSIPAPYVSKLKNADQLPVADVLQSFGDITGGLQASLSEGSSEPFQIGGMIVTDGQLHWTLHKYYNVEGVDYPSHGVTDLDLSSFSAEGPWHLGPMRSGRPEWHSYKHAGYIMEVPDAAADQWFGGRNLISGLQISTGLQYSSQGPALFAYRLPDGDVAAGQSLSALPLCWYSEQNPMPGHHPADRWTGGAWLTLGDKQAIIVVGRKSHGAVYYGEPRPGDCSPYKGYHGPPYDVEVAFYSPASLIHAAHGQSPALGLSPWLRWDTAFDGGSLSQYLFPTCGQDVGGIAYDRERNLIYLAQIDAALTQDNQWEPLPVIHVFRIVE